MKFLTTRSFRILAASVCLVMLASSSPWARYQPGVSAPKSTIIKGKVTVQFEDNVNTNRFARGFGSVVTGIPSVDQLLLNYKANDAQPVFTAAKKPAVNSGMADLTRFYEITFPDSIPVNDVIQALSQNPNIRMAEPVWEYHIDLAPNDPQWSSQWDMSPGPPDPDTYDAWGMETGSDSIKVAIVDTGVLYKHPDLTGNIWVNPGEDINHNNVVWDIDDINGVDDDGNGFVDDLIGWDFVTTITNPAAGEDGGGRDNDPSDFAGHGTHVSGTVAAMNNNSTNVTGMAGGWYGGNRAFRGSRIVPCRAGGLNTSGQGTLASNDLAAAIDYARLVGANVINASWGGGGFSSPLSVAMANAINSGITFAHSAGNDNSDVQGWQDQIPGVISIAATDNNDIKASYSNYGAWITVSAPGDNILSTVSNGYVPGTDYYFGTSMAAPHVAGLSALIRSMMPSLTRQQVDSILINTTDNIDGLNPTYASQMGTGRINAFKALQNLANAKFTANITEGNVPLAVNFTDQSPNSPSSWNWDLGDGTLTSVQNPSHTYTTGGMYSVHLKITDLHGLGEEHLKNYMWVRADTLTIDSVMVNPGGTAVVTVRLTNTSPIPNLELPIAFSSTEGTTIDSVSVAGCRTSYFDIAGLDYQYDPFGYYSTGMTASPGGHYNYLPAGSGPILKYYFHVPSSATRGAVLVLDTMTLAGTKKPAVNSIWGKYFPIFKPGKIAIRACLRGKCLCGPPPINLSDISTLVAYLTTGLPIVDPYGCNINGVAPINLGDLSYLIAYLTAGGNPPPN